ncbi:hypothetical protein [Bacillus phage 1_ICo-2020]|uniref:Uncharacterized protein n=1 Tax=Bacillus phage 1_ICo-2020 TaxID=2759272 RepID=A0A7G8AKG1_9CAUD|nr:hypothetical protein [Bacillus phage 1_ICo-2020]
MESCSCVHCQADAYHIEQMRANGYEVTEEAVSKDDYMESKHSSIYDKLKELADELNQERQLGHADLAGDILDAVSAVDNELIALALELPTEQAEKLLAIQVRLY